jgi:hypothetical protein
MNINEFLNETACFDLQFRRDVRHKRTGSPVYYSWKAQFIVIGTLDKEDALRAVQQTLNCGRLHYITAKQLRFSVQKIDDIYTLVIPYFKANPLIGKKNYDFDLWAKAIEVIYRNKGKALNQWSKQDFSQLIDLQESMQQYKVKKVQNAKWLPIAKAVLEHLK